MKKNKPITSVILVLTVSVAITCCAAPASVTLMVPSLDNTNFASTNMTLMITEVKGGEKTYPMWSSSKIENKGFKEALTNALKRSGIFKDVFTDKKGDYILYTEIISQELKSGFPITSTLFVNYKLIEDKSNRELCKENILSQYDAKHTTFKEIGVERAKRANEGAVRNNLSQLVKKLSNIISQHEQE